MTVPKFDEKEMEIQGTIPPNPFVPELYLYDYPQNNLDAVEAFYNKDPQWALLGFEVQAFCPRMYPDNVARAMVIDCEPFDNDTQGSGKDIFGIPWVYVPTAMGCMEDNTVPHLLDDANDWKDVIKFPDIDSWDWEGGAAANNGTYLKEGCFYKWWFQNGFFERLISFMGFEEACFAMFDEDQQDAVAELMMALADMYNEIIDRVVKWFPLVNCIYLHDDWGSSIDTFLSPDLVHEIIVPAMKKVVDHIHEVGLHAEFHSCGANIKQVPNMIECGWELWQPQADVNDIRKLYDLYGDQILLAIPCEPYDAENATEEEQRAAARQYVDTFCNPGKPVMFSTFDGGRYLTPAFQEELYRLSRKRYAGEEY